METTHSVSLLAKSVEVLVSYQAMSWRSTARKNSPLIRKTWERTVAKYLNRMIGLVTHLPGSGKVQTGDENPTQDPEDSGQNEHVDAEPLMQQFHFYQTQLTVAIPCSEIQKSCAIHKLSQPKYLWPN